MLTSSGNASARLKAGSSRRSSTSRSSGWERKERPRPGRYFCGGARPLEEAGDDPDFERLFLTWFVFDWQKPPAAAKLSMRKWPVRPIAATFLKEQGLALASLDERLARAALAAPLTFAAVESVAPGRSIVLRDILTGVRHTVMERSASQSVLPGSLLFACTVTVDAVSIMVGTGHWVIPPAFHNRMIDFRERLAAGGLGLDAQRVKALHADVVDLYGAIVDELLNPTPPTLQNTDGDPIAPTKLEFELGCSPEEAVERLAPLAYGHTREDLLEGAEQDAVAGLTYTVPWLVRGNRVHKDWDNTSLATMTVMKGVISAEANSERRARRVRKEIERRLRGAVVFLRQETLSIEALLREDMQGGRLAPSSEHEALQRQPEVRARLREMNQRHWEAWLDHPVPALGGLSPRAAAKSPLGRERLAALLADFEDRNRRQEPDQRVDIDWLRRELDLKPAK